MTDEEILALFYERREEAIRETEKQYGSYFLAIARALLGNTSDAEEVVNDLYLKAWNTIPPAKPERLKPFLGSMTRQLALNRLEKNAAQKRGGGQYPYVLDELAEIVPDPGEDGGNYADSVALGDALNRFLRTLPDDARRIFIRRYVLLCPVADIARALSLGESKVKSSLMRSREKLKHFLKKEGFPV